MPLRLAPGRLPRARDGHPLPRGGRGERGGGGQGGRGVPPPPPPPPQHRPDRQVVSATTARTPPRLPAVLAKTPGRESARSHAPSWVDPPAHSTHAPPAPPTHTRARSRWGLASVNDFPNFASLGAPSGTTTTGARRGRGGGAGQLLGACVRTAASEPPPPRRSHSPPPTHTPGALSLDFGYDLGWLGVANTFSPVSVWGDAPRGARALPLGA